MKSYKPDQGRLARMATFWGLVGLVLFGCRFFYVTLETYAPATRPPLGGIVIPIVAVDLSISFLVSLAIFLVGTYGLHRWLQSPRTADLLIETESELRKVTWPSMQEVINSSLVVIVSVLVLMAFLAGADMFLGNLVRRLIFGWGGQT